MKTLEDLLEEEIKAFHNRRMHKHNYTYKETRYYFDRKTRNWFLEDFEKAVREKQLPKTEELLNFVRNEVR